jgi:hypothetical protein
VLGGRYRIKRGQWVLVVLPLVQRDPRVWPDPERFDPDRFGPGQTSNRAHAYKPFGTGQRACIGRQFALHEAVLTLALILHRYDLTPEDGYRLQVSETVTLKPRGFRLALNKRDASSRSPAADTELRRTERKPPPTMIPLSGPKRKACWPKRVRMTRRHRAATLKRRHWSCYRTNWARAASRTVEVFLARIRWRLLTRFQ